MPMVTPKEHRARRHGLWQTIDETLPSFIVVRPMKHEESSLTVEKQITEFIDKFELWRQALTMSFRAESVLAGSALGFLFENSF